MCAVVALLGKGETPADGVTDYCELLARALADQGVHTQIDRFQWFERGWTRELFGLLRRISPRRGDWTLIQYTAMAWSRHGFPIGVLVVVAALRLRGVRCAIVMHEASSQHQNEYPLVGRIRAFVQDSIVRTLYLFSSLSIFTIPLARVRWLPANHAKGVFIPLGANIPACESVPGGAVTEGLATRKVSVFCLSGHPSLKRELDDISAAARAVVKNGVKLRMLFVGRGTAEAAVDIASAFQESGVEIVNLGMMKPFEVAAALSESDAFLYVRGPVSLQRSSALAGIACGLPVVGYAGEDVGTPLAEAGTLLVPLYDQLALGEALTRVLLDDGVRRSMRARSLLAQRKYFSWALIAESFIRELGIKRSVR
jgi:glycosyltransferase involved in cell wall biosynthesis